MRNIRQLELYAKNAHLTYNSTPCLKQTLFPDVNFTRMNELRVIEKKYNLSDTVYLIMFAAVAFAVLMLLFVLFSKSIEERDREEAPQR